MKDIELYRDSFQNFRIYQLPKAQLIIADVPYNLGTNAYASNPSWYKGGDHKNPKVHPTQKPIPLLRRLIEIFTDKGDVVIDPVAGSGSTLLAAAQCGRKAYGFEIDRNFYNDANKYILSRIQKTLFQ